MNNPFDYIPDKRCDEAFDNLCRRLAALKQSGVEMDRNLLEQLESGKMIGVLLAENDRGEIETLYAFSGQLGADGFDHPMFVEPVFDYLEPDGYFKTHEREISLQSIIINEYKNGPLAQTHSDYESEKERVSKEIEEFKEQIRVSKSVRDVRRAAGCSKEEEKAMIRQSQYEKAELHRLKKKGEARLAPLEEEMSNARQQYNALKERRRIDSEELQRWLFDNFKVDNASGESKSLNEIFAETAFKVPPSGAGECCAPKLLQAAYRRGLQPLTIAEYWYGKSKDGEVRIHGHHYPACRGKCRPLLGWMLQGLDVTPPLGIENRGYAKVSPEIIFENEWFCVVNKPAGMLSVPGKGGELSVQQWLIEHYNHEQSKGIGKREIKMAHRLDQDTSGLLMATFGEESYKEMQRLFATRQVNKEYKAILEGDYRALKKPQRGIISLSLAPDILDRPRQRVDSEHGKESVTEYEFITSDGETSTIIFRPHTGRTHQLRVHAASQSGLVMPIVGDRLYGNKNRDVLRLHLHAMKLEFRFPITGEQYCFEIPVTEGRFGKN